MGHRNLIRNGVCWIGVLCAFSSFTLIFMNFSMRKPSAEKDYWHREFEGEIEIATTPDCERIVVGCMPKKTNHNIWLLDSKGKIIWHIKLKEGEQLGGVGISRDGMRIFFDYFVDPGIVHETKVIKYKGGLRCVNEKGKILWEKQAEGINIGYPGASPLGLVHEVNDKLVVLVKPWWEGIAGWRLINFDGQIICEEWRPSHYLAEDVYLSPDSSYILLDKSNEVICLDIRGKEQWRIPGSLFSGILRSNISEDGEFILLRVTAIPGTKRQELRDMEQDIEGLALVTRDGKIVWGQAKVAWYLPPFPKLLKIGTFDNLTLVEGQLGKSKDALVIFHELGRERSLYLFPLTRYHDREFVRSIPLPHRNSIKEVTLLSRNGHSIVILSEMRKKDKQTKDLKVRLFNMQGVLQKELVIEEFSVLHPKRVALSSNGQRLIIVIANRLYLVNLRHTP